MPRTAAKGGRIFIARESFIISYNGADTPIVAGITRVREGHPILDGHENLFEEIKPHPSFEWETATAGPDEVRGE